MSRQIRLRATRQLRTSSTHTRRTRVTTERGVDLTDHLGELGAGTLTLAWFLGPAPVSSFADSPRAERT